MVTPRELASGAGFDVTRESVLGALGCSEVAEDGAIRGALDNDTMGDTEETDNSDRCSVAATADPAGKASPASGMLTRVEI